MFGIASNKVQVFAQQIGTRLLPYAKDFMLDITPKLDSMMDTALNGIDKIMSKAEQLFGYLSSNGPQAAGRLEQSPRFGPVWLLRRKSSREYRASPDFSLWAEGKP